MVDTYPEKMLLNCWILMPISIPMIITYHDWFCQWLVARGRRQSMLRTNDDLLPIESKRKGIYFSVRNMHILDHEYPQFFRPWSIKYYGAPDYKMPYFYTKYIFSVRMGQLIVWCWMGPCHALSLWCFNSNKYIDHRLHTFADGIFSWIFINKIFEMKIKFHFLLIKIITLGDEELDSVRQQAYCNINPDLNAKWHHKATAS